MGDHALRAPWLGRMLAQIEDPRGAKLLAIYEDHSPLLSYAGESNRGHHKYKGGYRDHMAESMRINRILYAALNEFDTLPFTRDSVDICLFLRQIEQPFCIDGWDGHPDVLTYKTSLAKFTNSTKVGHLPYYEANALGLAKVRWDIITDWKLR